MTDDVPVQPWRQEVHEHPSLCPPSAVSTADVTHTIGSDVKDSNSVVMEGSTASGKATKSSERLVMADIQIIPLIRQQSRRPRPPQTQNQSLRQPVEEGGNGRDQKKPPVSARSWQDAFFECCGLPWLSPRCWTEQTSDAAPDERWLLGLKSWLLLVIISRRFPVSGDHFMSIHHRPSNCLTATQNERKSTSTLCRWNSWAPTWRWKNEEKWKPTSLIVAAA